MINLFYIFIGGGLGSLARYVLVKGAKQLVRSDFPLGTLFVNLLGCFAIGLLWGILGAKNIGSKEKSFLFIGFLGGFTTFSSFMLENLHLVNDHNHLHAFSNILASNLAGFLLVFLGYFIANNLLLQQG